MLAPGGATAPTAAPGAASTAALAPAPAAAGVPCGPNEASDGVLPAGRRRLRCFRRIFRFSVLLRFPCGSKGRTYEQPQWYYQGEIAVKGWLGNSPGQRCRCGGAGAWYRKCCDNGPEDQQLRMVRAMLTWFGRVYRICQGFKRCRKARGRKRRCGGHGAL